jgi:WXXGXW repeat (2 copies)
MTLTTSLKKILGTTLVAGFVLAAAASADAKTRVFVRVGPPAPIVEYRSVAPGSRYVWVPGYYRWDGYGYGWAPGRWVVPPRARAVWVAPRWAHSRHGWYVVGGYWR